MTDDDDLDAATYDLARSLDAYNAIKHEHVTDRHRQPGNDSIWNDDDTAMLDAMFASSGIAPEVAAACAIAMVESMMREVRRAGVLRAANQRHLRALLFSTWLDGLGLGLYHSTHPQTTPDPEPET